MQRRIQSLPAQLANQIAAGEVVERPASVVKELLENSIDAGATRIELEVEQGGAKLIRVLDDGRGIHRDDLPLAIAPHATSKIYSQRELERIASLGFRGEALASIASVSRFRLASRLAGEEQGWELRSDGPQGPAQTQPCAQPAGTRVEVRELFYNVPARRKFLRSERTEFLHIEEVLRRLALSRFDIAFSLVHNGRQVLRLRPALDAAQRSRRIGEILGRGFVGQALQLEHHAAGLQLWGWFSPPQASRSQADSQYFYLNGRIVRDKLISHAVRQACQALFEPGRHPAYVLYLELDPEQVDVNVHPTKHEVRFRQTRLIHDFITSGLRRALAGGEQAQEALPSQPGNTGGWRRDPLQFATTRVAEAHPGYSRPATVQAGTAPVAAPARQPLGEARLLLHRHYLLSESVDGPLLVDLAAARTLLLRRRFEQQLAAKQVTAQPLLIPQSLQLGAGEAERLLAAGVLFRRFGFALERLGEETVVLRQIPALCRGMDAEALLQLLLQQAREAEATSGDEDALLAQLIEQLVEAVPLSLSEAGEVLRQLEALPGEGREFVRRLSLSQLQQWFAAGEAP